MAMTRSKALGVLFIALAVAACGDDEGTSTSNNNQGGDGTGASGAQGGSGGTGGMGTGATGGTGGDATGGAGGIGPMVLTSTAFNEGDMIPLVNTCTNFGGDNESPPLSWTPGPAGTQSYAIVMRDLDFMNGFIHWVIWDIPAGTTSLPQNIPDGYDVAMPAGAHQARRQSCNCYLGPCSGSSVNTYEWTVYALEVSPLPGMTMNTSSTQAEAAILGANPLASASLSGES